MSLTLTKEKVQKVPISKSGTVNTLDTQAHKKITVLENTLRLQLQPFIDDILKEKQDASLIYYKYNTPVKDTFRSFIEMMYKVGNFYTNMANGTMPKNTDIDQDMVKKLTDFGTDKFFGKVIWFGGREQTIKRTNYFVTMQNTIAETFNKIPQLIKQEKIKTMNPININKQVDQVVRKIAFLSLNTAVAMKTRQLTQTGNVPVVKLAGPRTTRAIMNDPSDPIEGISRYVMWVTAGDEKVCWQWCRPLDGEIFDTSDGDFPIPILSTHDNCRCRLMNMKGRNLYNDPLIIANILNMAEEVSDEFDEDIDDILL